MRRFLIALFLVMSFILPVGSALAYSDDTVLGTVEFLQQATNNYGCTTIEMELCDTVADAVRSACNTQISIVNGGDFIHNLEGGEATWGDILFLFSENRTLAVAEISGADLLEILEYGVSHAVVDMSAETLDIEASSFDGFPQISGFSFAYDPTAQVGQRIVSAELSDGTLISADMTLTLAASEYMLSGGFGYPAVAYQSTGITLAEAMAQYFDGGTIGDPTMRRITHIGLSDRFTVSRSKIAFVSVAGVMACFCFGKIRKKSKKENEMF